MKELYLRLHPITNTYPINWRFFLILLFLVPQLSLAQRIYLAEIGQIRYLDFSNGSFQVGPNLSAGGDATRITLDPDNGNVYFNNAGGEISQTSSEFGPLNTLTSTGVTNMAAVEFINPSEILYAPFSGGIFRSTSGNPLDNSNDPTVAVNTFDDLDYDPATDRLYLHDQTTNAIYYAFGGNLDTWFTLNDGASLGPIEGPIAVDGYRGFLYFMRGGVFSRINLDGDLINLNDIVNISAGTVTSMDIDPVSGKVYLNADNEILEVEPISGAVNSIFAASNFADLAIFAPVSVANFNVSNSNNDGLGSLRYAIRNANLFAGQDYSINLNTAAVNLSNPLPNLAGNTVFNGQPGRTTIRASNPGSHYLMSCSGNFTVTLQNIILEQGFDGGGFDAPCFTNKGSNVFFDNCIFQNNRASVGEFDNLGIIHNQSGSMTLRDCSILNNNSSVGGSSAFNARGIFFVEDGDLTLDRTTIYDNIIQASNGNAWGAISMGPNADNLEITNCTLYANVTQGDASSLGGAMYINNAALVNVVNSTLVGNRAEGSNASGGGIELAGGGDYNLNVINSYVIANSATNHPNIFGVLNSSQTSVFGNVAGTTFNNDVNSTTGALYLNYLSAAMDTLGLNGGPTKTIASSVGSAGIDAGSTGALVPNVDQRGVSRVNNPDIGAYEFEPVVSAIVVNTSSVVQITENSFQANLNLVAPSGASQYGFLYYPTTGSDLTLTSAGVLNVSQTGGASSGSFNLNITGLSPATQYSVRAFAINASSPNDTVYGARIDVYTLATEPAAHTNTFVFLDLGETFVDLGWDNVPGADGYVILSFDSPTSFSGLTDGTDPFSIDPTTIGSNGFLEAVFDDPGITSFEINGLDGSLPYYFYIIPYSQQSGIAQTTNYLTSNPVPELFKATSSPPIAPSGLVATATSNTSVMLTWQDNSDNEIGFEIQFLDPIIFDGATNDFEFLDVVEPNTTSYEHEDLIPNKVYFYRIRAFNFSQNSNFTMPDSARTSNPPRPPQNLQAFTISNQEVRLIWEDVSRNETSFEIFRSTNPNQGFTLIASVGEDTVSYSDTGLMNDTQYFYRIRSNSTTEGSSQFSNIAGAETADIPSAPNGLSSQTDGPTQITITWVDNSSNELGFSIERANILVAEGFFTEIAQVGPNVTSYVDSNLTANQIYTYRVSSFNDEGFSIFSTAEVVTTDSLLSINAPARPFNLEAEPVSESEIALRWEDNSSNEDFFSIERSINASSGYVEIARVGANIRRYQDTDLQKNTVYYYRVRAGNQGGFSGYTNVAQARTECNLVVAVSVNTNIISNICDDKSALLIISTNVIEANYQWYRNDRPIPDANFSSYLANQDGEYNCTVFAGDCEEAASNPVVVVLDESFTVSVVQEGDRLLSSITGAESYQWYFDFEPILGATNDSYRPRRSGTYYLVITTQNCSATSSLFNFTITGSEDQALDQALKVFPNPTREEVFVELDSPEPQGVDLILRDLHGRIHYRESRENFPGQAPQALPVSNLSPGIYLLEFRAGQRVTYKKIHIQ